MQEELKQDNIHEKTSIMQFLVDNSAYDCMPQNSLIYAVEKNIKIVDAIQLLFAEKAEELLIWDGALVEWNCLFSLADAIKFTLLATRAYGGNQNSFSRDSLRRLEEDRMDMMVEEKGNEEGGEEEGREEKGLGRKLGMEDKEPFLKRIANLTVYEFMSEIYDLSTFKLIRVSLETKLTTIIESMLVQQIHRVVVEDKTSQMVTSIMSYKDFLLFLTRSVNEEFTNTVQYILPIGMLLKKVQSKESSMIVTENTWVAFDVMVNQNKSQWLHILDQDGRYLQTLFRQDFYLILDGWKIELLSMNLIQFIQVKRQVVQGRKSKLPEIMFFEAEDTFKDVVEKIILSERNTLVWVDGERRVKYTLGISELFSFYVLE